MIETISEGVGSYTHGIHEIVKLFREDELKEVWLHKDFSDRTFAKFKKDLEESNQERNIDARTVSQTLYDKADRALRMNDYTERRLE